MRFIVVTRDYSGLGFAVRLQDEGHEVILATSPSEEDQADPGRMQCFNLVGQGMVEKAPLSDVFAARADHKESYWIWDHNHSVEQNETLRPKDSKCSAVEVTRIRWSTTGTRAWSTPLCTACIAPPSSPLRKHVRGHRILPAKSADGLCLQARRGRELRDVPARVRGQRRRERGDAPVPRLHRSEMRVHPAGTQRGRRDQRGGLVRPRRTGIRLHDAGIEEAVRAATLASWSAARSTFRS